MLPRREFEGGLVSECSRLGRVGNTERALLVTMHQFEGTLRLGRMATAATRGSRERRLGLLLNIPPFVAHSTITPSASPRGRGLALSLNSLRHWRGWPPYATGLLPGLRPRRPARGPPSLTLPPTLPIMAWRTALLTDVS